MQSLPGKGSSFRVFLPALPEPVGNGNNPAEPEITVAGRGEVVVFVDDEKTIRQLAAEFLSQAGFQPVCFENGINALEWLADGHRCDIMVTDMTMPGMEGEELIEKVRMMRPDLPAILCTGYSREIESSQALQSTPSAFLNKPFSFPDLLSKIRTLLDKSRGTRKATGLCQVDSSERHSTSVPHL